MGRIPPSPGRIRPIQQGSRRPTSRVKHSHLNPDKRSQHSLESHNPRKQAVHNRSQPSPARRGNRPRTNLNQRSHPNLDKRSHPNLKQRSQGRASLREIIRARVRLAATKAAAPKDRPRRPAHPRICPCVPKGRQAKRRSAGGKTDRVDQHPCPAPGPRASPRRTCSVRPRSTSSLSPCLQRCATLSVATLNYPPRGLGRIGSSLCPTAIVANAISYQFQMPYIPTGLLDFITAPS
ncbi:hypothetical protein Mcate_02258 [Meiothermus taiwanensis]|uniref:Uncharacterized protein n=1 Tax=Meiothermus taiwanensis TaxID=172827 RepID=A0A399DZM7_9DEIN|nr:hypothetical protein Mcate_02258 [Meiothermus taiwanensis]